MAFTLDNWLRRIIQNPRRIVGPYLEPGHTAVDLGCGPGFFTVDIARMVGDQGAVIAVDMQPRMLDYVARKARRKGVAQRVRLHHSAADRIGLDAAADFVLAYYVVHETPDPAAFLSEIRGFLKPGGHLLIVEPRFHVTQPAFVRLEALVESVGYAVQDRPRGKGGRSLLLTHGQN
jgi:ubiquinone/menaquinone biosynthesis C-methylase UbiE